MKNLFIVSLLCLALFTACKADKKSSLDPYARLALNGRTVAQSTTSKAVPDAPYSLDTIALYAFDVGLSIDYGYGDITYAVYGLMKHDLTNIKIYFGDMDGVVSIDNKGVPHLGGLVTSNLHDVVLRAAFKVNNMNKWINAYEFWDLEGYKNMEIPMSDIRDTIGYVPNRVIRAAEAKIAAAFAVSDYEECMRLFEQAYTFIPITGAEWRLLKAKNEQ